MGDFRIDVADKSQYGICKKLHVLILWHPWVGLVVTMKADRERVKKGLREAIALLCKTGLQFTNELSVEGLLGVTLDRNEVFLISISELITNPYETTFNKQSLDESKTPVDRTASPYYCDDRDTDIPLNLAPKRRKSNDDDVTEIKSEPQQSVNRRKRSFDHRKNFRNDTESSNASQSNASRNAENCLKLEGSCDSFSGSENENSHNLSFNSKQFKVDFPKEDNGSAGGSSRESTPIPKIKRMLNPNIPSKICSSTNNSSSPEPNELKVVEDFPDVKVKQEKVDDTPESCLQNQLRTPSGEYVVMPETGATDAIRLEGLPNLFQQQRQAMMGLPVFPGMPDIFHQTPPATMSAVQVSDLQVSWRSLTAKFCEVFRLPDWVSW